MVAGTSPKTVNQKFAIRIPKILTEPLRAAPSDSSVSGAAKANEPSCSCSPASKMATTVNSRSRASGNSVPWS